MNLHFTFSIREISEVRDSDQVIKIPMYFTVAWEVSFLLISFFSDVIFHQENRIIIDRDHRSWEDDSTGPKGEHTEEAEVCH